MFFHIVSEKFTLPNAMINQETGDFISAMKISIQISSFLSFLSKMRAYVFILTTCLTLSATAADDNDLAASIEDSEASQPVVQQGDPVSGERPDQDEPIEEVTVTGQRLISHLRLEALRAEDRAFDLFNQLNDDDQFDIVCRRESPTGTRIKYRQCAPKFFIRAEAHATSVNRSGGTIEVRALISGKYTELREQMQGKILENTELLDAFLEAQELRQELGETVTTYWDRKSRIP